MGAFAFTAIKMQGQLDWDGVVMPIQEITWENVLATANKLQGLEINEDFFVTYKDEEGDVINVKNAVDLNEAIRWAQEQGVPCLCLHVPFSADESDSDESWTEIDNGSPRGQHQTQPDQDDVDESEKRSIVEDDGIAEVSSEQPSIQEHIEEDVLENEKPVSVAKEEDDDEQLASDDEQQASDEAAACEQPIQVVNDTVVETVVEPETVEEPVPAVQLDDSEHPSIDNSGPLTLTPISQVFSSAPVQSVPTTGIDKIIELMCSVGETSFTDNKEYFTQYFANLPNLEKVMAFFSHPAVQTALSAVAQAEKTTPGTAQKATTTQLIKVLYQNSEVLGLLSQIPNMEQVLLRVLNGMKGLNLQNSAAAQAPRVSEPVVSEETHQVEEDTTPKTLHNLVTCDGCNSDDALRDKAVAEGLRNAEGMILGIRYKSAVVLDYDLCESCEASGRFQSQYGPFLKIVDPETAPELILCAMPGASSGLSNQLDSLDWRNPLAREFLEFVRTRQQRAFPQSRRTTAPVSNASTHESAAKVEQSNATATTRTDLRCKHLLKTFNAPHSNFTCDICGKQAVVHALLHGCRICNFDVCQACYAEKDLGLSLASPPRVSVPEPVQAPPAPPQAKFVSDVTLADGCAVRAGERLNKTWRVRNSGPEKWPVGTRISHVGGESFGGPVNGVEVPLAGPGEAVNITVPLVMPSQPGRYTSYWRLMTPHPENSKFGHRFWVTVNVLSPTASIAPMPAPSVAAPRGPPPPPPLNSLQLPGSPPVREQPVLRPAPTGPFAPPPPPPPGPVQLTPFEETVARIAEFGFTDIDRILEVLNQVNGDAARAIEVLLEEN